MDEANNVADALEEPIQFSKGINLKELLTSNTEFCIDLDYKNTHKAMKADPLLNDDLFGVDDDDEESDILKTLEQTTEYGMLSSPEYHSFDELGAKMTDCIPTGECKMLVLEEGDAKNPLVPYDAEVTIHYAAYWEKEKIPFDSTLTMNFGKPQKHRLGDGRLIPGLEIALTLVRGPAARLLVLLEPALAWGARGVPPRIRAERALFVITLYDVQDRATPEQFNSLPKEEQKKYENIMKTVESLHAEAKKLFSKKKYKPARNNYQHSMLILNSANPENELQEDNIKKFRINTYVNLAMCYCKLNKPNYAISMLENLDYVSDVDKHCKGLFYYGKAYQLLGNNEEALKYYKKALTLEPRNKDIGKTLAELDEYLKKTAVKEKELWQNAFQSTPAKKESIVYDVEQEFENGVRKMCQDLTERNEYAKFDLPTGLSRDEVMCIKSLIRDFEGLVLVENGEGKRKKMSIIRKLL
ncbi:inactive peptidyl-prolyl cis-trans isomerase shutdown-like [Cydia splendana]|uniref:inactive peptidyl-prolyl cis-trans isomerase shutdown-like n=1 Tax=Cydia splendana TaxID=1100963 RepID=UPI002142B634